MRKTGGLKVRLYRIRWGVLSMIVLFVGVRKVVQTVNDSKVI